MRLRNSVLDSIDEFRQSRLDFDILNGIDTAKLYSELPEKLLLNLSNTRFE